ncbi:MAG: LamG domain-containing protein, partial [Planctomycetota bacterium]|nr:LamG domain-containing protein [Planctomycetota bacterium]
LAWHSTYYWRVNGIEGLNPASPWKGNVWSFETADFITVDDFESYNDLAEDDPASNRIYVNWIDGFGTAANGSVVGYAELPLTEHGNVHGGGTSMPYSYDNNGKYSEANITLVSPRDWTEEGVGVLSLWFNGNSSNDPEAMYVVLNGIAVVYHDDPAAAQAVEWTQWTVDLQEFASQGVDLTNVNSIGIGFGYKNVQAGGSGKMLFDNIALYRPPTTPTDQNLVGWWMFDESTGATAADSSGNGNDGVISGADWISPGADGAGSCLDFDGQGTDRVSLGAFDVTGSAISIACWYKADNLDTPGNDPRLFSKAIGGSSQDHWFMISSSRVGNDKVLRFRLKTDEDTGEIKADTATGAIELDVWTHVAAVWDGAVMRLYKNGAEVGSLDKGGTLSTNPDAKVSIGNQPDGAGDRPWDGLIDDVRLYDKALSEAEIAALANVQ